MEGVSPCIPIFCEFFSPIIEMSVNFHGVKSFLDRYWSDTFIPADVLSHLHIIIVGITTLHWAHRPVEFRIVLIDKPEMTISPQPGCGAVSIQLIFSGCPFIPVIDVEKLWICSDGFIPSFLKIDSVTFGVWNRFS